MVYEKKLWDCGYDDYPTLENSFFGVVKLVKSVVIDKYKYSGYVIGFDKDGTFSVDNGIGKNFDNKKKDILILGDGSTERFYY